MSPLNNVILLRSEDTRFLMTYTMLSKELQHIFVKEPSSMIRSESLDFLVELCRYHLYIPSKNFMNLILRLKEEGPNGSAKVFNQSKHICDIVYIFLSVGSPYIPMNHIKQLKSSPIQYRKLISGLLIFDAYFIVFQYLQCFIIKLSLRDLHMLHGSNGWMYQSNMPFLNTHSLRIEKLM